MDVKTHRGAKIEKIRQELMTSPLDQYEQIIIHVGGNNLSEGQTQREIFQDYDRLITDVNHKNPTTKIAFVEPTPRTDCDVREIQSVLHQLFKKHDIRVIMNYHQYLDSDHYLNDTLYNQDGIHLNKRGTSLLLRTIDTIIPITKGHRNLGFSATTNTSSCDFCGESNHTTKSCKHGKPIHCHGCGQSGHKAKLCYTN